MRERWDRAIQFGWLTLGDFTFIAVNWKPKADNIRLMIETAGLTSKSVVFVDDNPVEREAVRAAIAGIRVIGENPYGTKRQLLWSAETQIPTLTAESTRRDEMTRKQKDREAERGTLSREEFLTSLGAALTVKALVSETEADFRRAFELLNKTNQFNTTGERWDLRRMRAFLVQGGRLYVFSLQDKFTQYGLVGVICYRVGEFVQFAMSCRVLGLEVETSVLNAIMAHEHVEQMTAWVIKTEANMVCRDVYARCGFREGENGVFKRDGRPVPPLASHLRLVLTERG